MNLLVLAILSVVAAAGIAGGYAGYLLGPPDPGELPIDKRRWLLRRSLVLGVVAAFMVPVFLRVVGAASGNDENLVDQLAGPNRTLGMWLVVAGFCLIAAVSSQRFISTLTNKLLEATLKEAREAKVVASEARQEVEDLEQDVQQAAAQNVVKPIPELQKAVLWAVYSNAVRRPDLREIAAKGNWRPEELSNALNELEERGLVSSKTYEDGHKRWRVRTVGKTLIAGEQLRASSSEARGG
jgi:DNA-binding MarR family transcriptional regulator